MGDIRIKQVQVENFLTIKQASMNFSNRGLILVEGPNGVGKSALCVESLSYGLFGVSERYGKKRDEVVNRFVDKDCRVYVQLEVDGMDVIVDSYRKHGKHTVQLPNGKTYQAGGNEIFLFINGEDKRGNSNDQTLDKIVKLLDMDYTGFTSSIVFGQTISQYFSGLSDSDQKKVVERLLGITWVPNAYEISKGDRERCSAAISLIDTEIQSYSNKLEEGKKELEQYKEKYESFEDGRKIKIEELKKLFVEMKEISNIEEDIHNKEETKTKLDKESEELTIGVKILEKELAIIDTEDKRRIKVEELNKFFIEIKDVSLIQELIAKKEKELEIISFEYENLTKEVKGLEKKMDAIDVAISIVNRSISSLNHKVEDLDKSKVGSICEKCGSTIEEKSVFKYRFNLEDEIKTSKTEFSTLNVKRDGLVSDLSLQSAKSSDTYQMLKEFEGDLKELKLKLNVIVLENARIEERNLSISNQIKELQKNKNLYIELTEVAFKKEKKKLESNLIICNDKYSEVSKNIRMMEEGLKELKLKLNVIVLENARIEERNLSISNQIKELQDTKNIYGEMSEKSSIEVEKLKALLEEKRIIVGELNSELEYHQFWENGFSNRGIKSYIIESVIPQINEYASMYASALGGKYDISFSPQRQTKGGEIREKFTPIVVNKLGSGNYEGNSNGERRAIDAIMMFVLGDLAASRNNKRFSLLILDDVFEKLDEEVCDSVIGVLRMMTRGNNKGLPKRESIFVLSHLDYFKSKFENRIEVKKENGETILKEI
jgi:DNA repair exonuclease SbcCD ATPase subunit